MAVTGKGNSLTTRRRKSAPCWLVSLGARATTRLRVKQSILPREGYLAPTQGYLLTVQLHQGPRPIHYQIRGTPQPPPMGAGDLSGPQGFPQHSPRFQTPYHPVDTLGRKIDPLSLQKHPEFSPSPAGILLPQSFQGKDCITFRRRLAVSEGPAGSRAPSWGRTPPPTILQQKDTLIETLAYLPFISPASVRYLSDPNQSKPLDTVLAKW
jgi:hypothetical protein